MKGDRGPWTPDHLSVAALHTLGPRTCGFSLYPPTGEAPEV